jgi:hypothetical protein
MNNSEAGMLEREVGRAPIAAHLRSARLVWEAERRVGRARQIVARQRDLVARVGEEEVPIAVALLQTFERSLALFEEALAGRKRGEALIVRGEEQLVCNSKALLPAPISNCLEPADVTRPKLDVASIMEILREGGYDCELAQETLH